MKPTNSLTAKRRVEAKDVQKASLFHFIDFELVNVSSNLSIKAWDSEAAGVRGVRKMAFSQAWPTAAFYLLNQSAALGLLTIKLKTLLVQAKNGRVVAIKSGSAHLCKCILTGRNREGWRYFSTRRNMPILHCENCG